LDICNPRSLDRCSSFPLDDLVAVKPAADLVSRHYKGSATDPETPASRSRAASAILGKIGQIVVDFAHLAQLARVPSEVAGLIKS